MSTALDTDIATFVGEMPAQPCESLGHRDDGKFHDDGGATHYARVICPSCKVSLVKAYCHTLIQFILSDGLLRCECGEYSRGSEAATILGPVNK